MVSLQYLWEPVVSLYICIYVEEQLILIIVARAHSEDTLNVMDEEKAAYIKQIIIQSVNRCSVIGQERNLYGRTYLMYTGLAPFHEILVGKRCESYQKLSRRIRN